jgi:hypothetical protein
VFRKGDFLLKKGAGLPIQGKTAITERDVELWRGKKLVKYYRAV